jgi:excisionase family DNA binding protein
MQAYRIDAPEHAGMVRDMTERLTLTIPETARLLGISRGAAYAAASDRTIPTIKVGRRLLVPRAALDRMLDIDRVGQASEKGE